MTASRSLPYVVTFIGNARFRMSDSAKQLGISRTLNLIPGSVRHGHTVDIIPASTGFGDRRAKATDARRFFRMAAETDGRSYDLHTEHINPAFVKMLRAIGFDKGYVRGEGCYLWDADGNKYLDLLTGWGVFALGRNHPEGPGDLSSS